MIHASCNLKLSSKHIPIELSLNSESGTSTSLALGRGREGWVPQHLSTLTQQTCIEWRISCKEKLQFVNWYFSVYNYKLPKYFWTKNNTEFILWNMFLQAQNAFIRPDPLRGLQHSLAGPDLRGGGQGARAPGPPRTEGPHHTLQIFFWFNRHLYIQGGPKKVNPKCSTHNFVKYWPILKILSSLQSSENLQCSGR